MKIKTTLSFCASLIGAAVFFVIAIFFNCFFDLRHLPGILVAAIGLLWAIGIAASCLLTIFFFFKAYGTRTRQFVWVVPAAQGWLLLIGIFLYLRGMLVIMHKYCS